jgi:Tol biopolymer transport system component
VVHQLEGVRNVESVEGISADGEVLAYTSNVTGRTEVYVLRLDGTGSMRQVSTDGGRLARWSRTGRDLFFFSGNRAWRTTISGKDLAPSKPVELFETETASDVVTGWDVARDGRFLLSVRVRRTTLEGLQNWQSAIARQR